MWQLASLLLFCISPVDSLYPQGVWRVEPILTTHDGIVSLEDPWFISETVIITHRADTLSLSPWYWDDSLKAFTAGCAEISAGDTIIAKWRSAAVSDRSTFRYYEPASAADPGEEADSLNFQKTPPFKSPSREWSGIRRSGTIVRGVKFGSAGESGSTSGLHLEMSGRPAPGIEIEAIIDDRSLGSSSGRSSATVAEIDRLLISGSTRHLSGSLGDLDVVWQQGEFSRIERRLKGVRFGANYNPVNADAIAGGGNTRFATITLSGRNGDQGPYELSNRFGNADVTVVAGSEKVSLNGRRLKRGVDADYTINLDRGTILFHPSLTILDDSRIDVEYEYSEETYSKLLLAGRGSVQNESWRIGFQIAEEGFDGDNPLAFDWTPESRALAARAGDDPTQLVTTGISSVETGKGDYLWGINSDGDSILVFSDPDSLGRPTGNLNVEFSLDSLGSYSRSFNSQWMVYTFHWVGRGLGNYSPERTIPLPDRLRLGVGTIEYQREGFSTVIETAISENDLNTLSPLNDDDNFGAALNWQSRWGNADSNLSVDLKIKHREAAFKSLSRGNPVDYQYHWGVAGLPAGQGESSIETEVKKQLFIPLQLKGSAGVLKLGNDYFISRFGMQALMKNRSADGVLSWEHLANEIDATDEVAVTDRLIGSYQQEYEYIKPRLKIRLEKQSAEQGDSLAGGYAVIESEPGIDIAITAGQRMSIDYLFLRKLTVASEEFVRASDSRSLKLGWDGKMKSAFWRSVFQRNSQTNADPLSKSIRSTSAAVSAGVGNYSSPARFSGDYRIFTGNNRSEVWTAVYVGEGNGGYRYEEGRYVVDPDGDFDLQKIATEETQFSSTVDFTCSFFWRREKTTDDSGKAVYPLGISGGSTRFDASAVTAEIDPFQTFFLLRSAFLSQNVSSFRWDWRQDIDFLDSESPGDGRLSLERRESRDGGLSNGEERLTESASFRLRLRILPMTSLNVTPFLSRARCWEASRSTPRSDVGGRGGEIQLLRSGVSRRWESSVTVGLESRLDRMSGISVTESRIRPLFIKRFGDSGSGRIEAEWRRLNTSPRAGYDLLKGWLAGDNYSTGFNLDRKMGKNISLTVSMKSRWRASRAPLHSGVVELTAVL